MTPDDRARLVALLERHEGRRRFPYTDTVGKLSIGVGRNLTDCGVSDQTIDQMCDEDIDRTVRALVQQFPSWFPSLDPVRQMALVDMGFMGPAKLLEFKAMIAAFARKDYDGAARAMLDSLWARQVHARADELAEMVRTGENLNT